MKQTVVRTYLNRKGRDRSVNTMSSIESSLNQFFRWKTGNDSMVADDISDNNIKEVTEDDIESYKDYMFRVYKTTGANTKLRNLRTFFNWAFASGHIDKNIFLNVTNFNEPERKPLSLSEDQVHAILNTAYEMGTWASKRDYVIMAVILSSGLRIAEVLSLTPNMILTNVYGEEVFYSLRVIGKRDKERVTIITQNVKELLDRYISKHDIEDDEKIFKVSARSVERNMKTYLEKSGISGDFTPHKLRHTFATMLYENGVQIEEIGNYLGHTDSNTTRRFYVNMGQKNRTEATKAHPLNGIGLKGVR